MKGNLTDSEVFKALLGQNLKETNLAMEQLYQDVYPIVTSYITQNNGTLQDALDVFQDAVVILFIKVRKNDYLKISSIKTYLIGVSRNLWLKQLRNSRTADKYLASGEGEGFITESIIHEKQVTIRDVLELIDKECKQLLLDFYFKSKSIKELTVLYSLGSEAATKNKKYRCMQRLISAIKRRELKKDDFSDE